MVRDGGAGGARGSTWGHEVSDNELYELGKRLAADDAAGRRAALEALSQRLRADDRQVRCTAAKALFQHFLGPLRRHIRCELARVRPRSGPGDGDAFQSRVETHVNSALLRLLERLDKGPLGAADEVHFLAYLKAIVRNARVARQRRALRGRTDTAVELDGLEAPQTPVAEALAEADERQRHEQLLAERQERLSEAEQRLLALQRDGHSYREIAALLGGSPGQYRAMMARVLRKLR
jgi:DNA-directed RNA polymerase specialized sigma24 family protein